MSLLCFALPKRKKIPFDCQAKAYYSRRYWFSRNRHNTQDNTTQHIMKITICIRWRLLFGFVFAIALESSFLWDREGNIERKKWKISWWTFCSVCSKITHWFSQSHSTSQYYGSHSLLSLWTSDSGSNYNCCMNRLWLPKCKFSGFLYYIYYRSVCASLWTYFFPFHSSFFSSSSSDVLKPRTFDVVKCSKVDYYFQLGVCRIPWKFHENKSNKNNIAGHILTGL